MEAAKAYALARNPFGAPSLDLSARSDIVTVENATDSLIDRYGVVGLEDMLIRPITNEGQFTDAPAFFGVEPTGAHRGKFGVLLDPLHPTGTGRTARAVVGGLTIGRVYVRAPLSLPDEFADIEPGITANLVGCGYGGARILWHEPESDREGSTAWAVLLIAPANCPGGSFHVRVTIDGGLSGSSSTSCTYTYTVTTLGGKVLGDLMTPLKRRYQNTPYTAVDDGTVGQGFYDEAGAFQLWDANELPDTEDC